MVLELSQEARFVSATEKPWISQSLLVPATEKPNGFCTVVGGAFDAQRAWRPQYTSFEKP